MSWEEEGEEEEGSTEEEDNCSSISMSTVFQALDVPTSPRLNDLCRGLDLDLQFT